MCLITVGKAIDSKEVFCERTVDSYRNGLSQDIAICSLERRNLAERIDFEVFSRDPIRRHSLDEIKVDLIGLGDSENGSCAWIALRVRSEGGGSFDHNLRLTLYEYNFPNDMFASILNYLQRILVFHVRFPELNDVVSTHPDFCVIAFEDSRFRFASGH